MADLLLSALVPVVMEKATDILVQRISDMWGLADQRERLHDKLLAVQHVLTDAEERGDANPAVKSWLAKLTSAAYDADDVLDEFLYEERRRDAVRRGHKVGTSSGFFSLENSILFRYKMSGKLKEVVGRIDELVTEMERFKFVEGRQGRVVDRDRTISYVIDSEVVGRRDDKENLVKLLTEVHPTENLMVLPVVGMGGLGKTTLAKLAYNDPRVKEHFKLLIWVCVSEEFEVGALAKLIIETVIQKNCEVPCNNMELLQSRLRQEISGKRYLLVLDDVWNEDVNKWDQLRPLLKCGDLGSAIVVTTRSGIVATIMGTVESYNLSCLGEEDSWSLFHKRAFSKGVKECQELVEIGTKMVQNCQGLPLAIKTLGSLMSSKYEVREWSAVLKESRFWEQKTAKDKVLPVLRLSFDHLSSSMKQCFAFCAVYPKDYEMDKEKLIQFWIANGFIPSDGSSSPEMIGNDIFNELAWRSFFQEVRQVCPGRWKRANPWEREDGHCSETKCKMHDLMHDLAQSIMGYKCQSIMHGLSQFNRPMINVHHISINKIPLDMKKVIDYFPSIRSLISWSNNDLSVKNLEFIKSNSLRTLELPRRHIEKTIFTPQKMKHLRYLEFSTYGITSLPEEISTLYLLQTLRLFNCLNLQKLPEGMRYMSSLRHLYIGFFDKLQRMPKGLGQLNCLQTLTIYIVGTDDGNGIGELNNLNNLSGQLHLYNLREIKHVVDAREANLMAKQNLDDLALCWGIPEGNWKLPESNAPGVMHCDPFEVLDALKPCNKLKVLKIEEYRGDKLPVWMTEYQMLENLIELYIIQCTECRKVPPVEKLPFLRILKLIHLDNLMHLCNSASTSAKGGEDVQVAFPSLKNITLSELPELCSWYEGEVGNKSSLIFPKLTTLEVIYCPKLTAIPILPSIISMTVKGNKYLSCFAAGLTTLHKLSLESQDGNETLSFQPWESLNELFLGNYNSIVPVDAKEGEQSITPTKCQSLIISKMIPSNTSLWFWKCFTFLNSLCIKNWDSLIYWPEEVFRFLNCLEHINVIECPNFLGSKLESTVGTSITEVLLPKLQGLLIDNCPNLVEIPKCSLSIQELDIQCCSKLHCLPEWLGNMVALKWLKIWECESFNTLPLSMGDLARLESLLIIGCPNLAYLPEGMEGLKALKQLSMRECPKIRALPEGLLQQVKNLNQLWIEDCPHLEKHFRKYGKYRHLISEIRLTNVGEESTSNLLKDLMLALPSCKNTCFSA
ncbi:disease resistance protein RGA2-like [Carex rostrata]